MKRNINITLLVVSFFLAINASAQESNDTTNAKITGVVQPMKNPVIFNIESTDPRFMERGPSKLRIDLEDIWMLKKQPPSDIEIDRKPNSPIFLGV
ncbi:MAG TPA: hypothetical protein VK872_17845, partial [Draconibacterium sp.]|nr:hypothetical protein [Draconibacterium sp.]